MSDATLTLVAKLMKPKVEAAATADKIEIKPYSSATQDLISRLKAAPAAPVDLL